MESDIYRAFPNAVYKSGDEVENIVNSHNYLGKHGWKAIGDAIRELAGFASVVSHFRHYLCAINMNYYTNAELAGIYFICGLVNENGRAAVRLYEERYPTIWQPNHQTLAHVHQNLVVHGSF
ncbi:hypothetical protein TNCV_2238151 [Trichonephila clavipes]|nr:hypothetical protein TNCV_2238151 [Trichonephila clavipes]